MTVTFYKPWYWQETNTLARSYRANVEYTSQSPAEEAYFIMMTNAGNAEEVQADDQLDQDDLG